MDVGRIEVQPVVDGRIVGSLPKTKPFPPVASTLWADQGGMFHEADAIESTLGGFLVHAGDRVVLVDAGAGPAVEERPASLHIEQGSFLASLAVVGVRPDEVTDVVFTHLHFDHIGWVSDEQAPIFPNAMVRCASADLDHFLAGPDEEQYVTTLYGAATARARLAPVLDRIETWHDDTTICPGIDIRLAPGHTPGSSVVALSDGTHRALLLGDLIHCPLELQDDDFDLLVDHDPVLAQRARLAYARELEGADVVASAAHFPGLRFGRLLPGEVERRWTFT